ncbi:glyoxalase superfamily protein [Mycoplana ramosa]|uniref:Glyoxalase superfamily protein n=1 Tax=Mycoplana ramosa TaxID=40837 RepID=A0ABW3YW06_MYCRA
MRPSTPLPALDGLKEQAKRLRSRFVADDQPISHSRALELVAAQYGYRDWNTLHAAVGNRPPFDPWQLGSRVRGHYLGQPFDAKVLGVQASTPGRYRLTLHFDEPVDVVTFESFSAFRQRVSCTVDETGRTAAKTSDGRPHLELEW